MGSPAGPTSRPQLDRADLHRLLDDHTTSGRRLLTHPRNPIAYLTWLLNQADLTDRPCAMEEVYAAYEAELAAQRRAAVPAQRAAAVAARGRRPGGPARRGTPAGAGHPRSTGPRRSSGVILGCALGITPSRDAVLGAIDSRHRMGPHGRFPGRDPESGHGRSHTQARGRSPG